MSSLFGDDACVVRRQKSVTVRQTLVMVVEVSDVNTTTITTSNHLPNAFCLR